MDIVALDFIVNRLIKTKGVMTIINDDINESNDGNDCNAGNEGS